MKSVNKGPKRHWKCRLGFHLWGLFYIRPMSDAVPWHGHARDCVRGQGCDRMLFHVFPPEGEIRYRNKDKT